MDGKSGCKTFGGGERRLPIFLYTDDLVLCHETEEDLKVMVWCFVEVCMRSPEVNADEGKVMLLMKPL